MQPARFTDLMPPASPRVSVVMANLNGAAHIAQAVRSVLGQSETALELIVSDDGSNDDSLARAAAAAGGDPRLIVLRSEAARTGPAAARNRALAAANGAWIAIVDNDDFIAPHRLAHLIDAAERDGADIAADDLHIFYEDHATPAHRHLQGPLAQAPRWISALDYAASNVMFANDAGLGYLKPVFRREGPYGAPRYDETLRIGEDHNLIQRMLIAGARMRIYPEPLYHYRKHAASISHRLGTPAIEAMLAAHAGLNAGDDAQLKRALDRQRRALERAHAYARLIDALKARDAAAAFKAVAARPSAVTLLSQPIAARMRRLTRG